MTNTDIAIQRSFPKTFRVLPTLNVLEWKKYLANYKEYEMESPSKETYTNLIGVKAKVMVGAAGYSPDTGQAIVIARSLI